MLLVLGIRHSLPLARGNRVLGYQRAMVIIDVEPAFIIFCYDLPLYVLRRYTVEGA